MGLPVLVFPFEGTVTVSSDKGVEEHTRSWEAAGRLAHKYQAGRCSEGQKFDTKAGENGARHGGRLVGWY